MTVSRRPSLAAAVSEVTGPGVTVRTGRGGRRRRGRSHITEDLAFLNIFLAAFGFIALFVGAFLILEHLLDAHLAAHP